MVGRIGGYNKVALITYSAYITILFTKYTYIHKKNKIILRVKTEIFSIDAISRHRSIVYKNRETHAYIRYLSIGKLHCYVYAISTYNIQAL